MNKGVLAANRGENGEARRLYERVIAGYTAQLGADHLDTLDAQLELAILLRVIGENGEARRLYERVIAGYTVQLGAEHLDTLDAQMNLAIVLNAAAATTTTQPPREPAHRPQPHKPRKVERTLEGGQTPQSHGSAPAYRYRQAAACRSPLPLKPGIPSAVDLQALQPAPAAIDLQALVQVTLTRTRCGRMHRVVTSVHWRGDFCAPRRWRWWRPRNAQLPGSCRGLMASRR